MSFSYTPSATAGYILCCECGLSIPPNTANMCLGCLRARVDITEGLPRQLTVGFCRGCERFLQPPTQWLPAELESKELLALLLRKIKLVHVRLVDAKFIWTEPHSRRIKMVLTVQKEVLSGTILQQSFEVETLMAGQQCSDCAKTEAKNTWQSVCQVRQKVSHKRTFLYLEQLILKHAAHRECVSIKGKPDGIDFFFGSKQHALKFQDFLTAVVPMRSRSSEQLISQDIHSGSNSYKFTFSIELVPLCRDDLIVLPPKLAQSLGSISPLVLCTKVTTAVHFIDPNSCQTAELLGPAYWASCSANPIRAIMHQQQLVEYYVMDVEQNHEHQQQNQQRAKLCDVQVCKVLKTGELSESTYFARSHLGGILRPGDQVLGYDLTALNSASNEDLDAYLVKAGQLPDAILVRKSYRHLRNARRSRRNWRLKALDLDVDEDDQSKDANVEMREREYDEFLEELEEDRELRKNVNIYKANASSKSMDLDEVPEDIPQVPIEELLEDLVLE